VRDAPRLIASPRPRCRPGRFDVEERIIAPIPNKSKALNQAFAMEAYKNADRLLRDSETVVSIGYSFNRYDQSSFEPLLRAASESKGRRLLIVSPDAKTIADSICGVFPSLTVEPINAKFKSWVLSSFCGLE
jgi:hypothetical protein